MNDLLLWTLASILQADHGINPNDDNHADDDDVDDDDEVVEGSVCRSPCGCRSTGSQSVL